MASEISLFRKNNENRKCRMLSFSIHGADLRPRGRPKHSELHFYRFLMHFGTLRASFLMLFMICGIWLWLSSLLLSLVSRTCRERAENLPRSCREPADKPVPQNPAHQVAIRRTTTAPNKRLASKWGTAVGARSASG